MKRYNYGIKRESPAIAGKQPKQYPWLGDDKHCDVCVTGGGLTGAMCALSAAEAGLSVVLITSDAIGYGDTGHLTGCARFDAGRTLAELDRFITVDEALTLYSMGFDALDGLQNLCARLDRDCKKAGIASGFERRDLLVFTDNPTQLELMEREYLAIRKRFPDSTWITRKNAESSFAFPISGGILTKEGSAVLNPYGLAHLCVMKAEELGAEIFEQTEAIDIQTPRTEEGCVIIRTSTHRTIYADRLVVASGSKGMRILPARVRFHTLFAVVGQLPENAAGWPGKCALGTFGRRSENCIISSGGRLAASCVHRSGKLKSFFKNADETSNYSELNGFTKTILPELAGATFKYQYSYFFVSPSDGLPVIGTHDDCKNCFFGLPGLYQDSGTPVFSYVASQIAEKYLTESLPKNNPLFDPMRL